MDIQVGITGKRGRRPRVWNVASSVIGEGQPGVLVWQLQLEKNPYTASIVIYAEPSTFRDACALRPCGAIAIKGPYENTPGMHGSRARLAALRSNADRLRLGLGEPSPVLYARSCPPFRWWGVYNEELIIRMGGDERAALLHMVETAPKAVDFAELLAK